MASAPAMDRVSEAFAAALAAQEAGVKVDLSHLCNGDDSVVREVRSLLEHLGMAGHTRLHGDSDPGGSRSGAGSRAVPGFLDCDELRRNHADVVAPSLLDEWGASSIGQQVGPYTLIGELGSGGMAVVFVAEQDKPRRKVALKLVRKRTGSDQLIRRFEREAELHGCLSHPGIAQVYDAGVAQLKDDAGHVVDAPFLAMELVQGPNIGDFCKAFGCDPNLILELVAQVCDAVQHAHQRGVIHRDLKPVNVLVTGGGRGEATAKVLDFGVARFREGNGPDAPTRLTQHGYVIGTLAYMSPEQLGNSCDVDTRGDVYAIGAMLFELLASRLPIDLSGCGLAEAAIRISEVTPPRLGTLNRAFRGDIETIVAKAVDKNPDRRYQSAAALGQDIRHALAGEPIQARRDSIAYTLSKQVARYKSLAAATMAMLLLITAGSFYVYYQQTLQLKASNAEAAALRREQAQMKLNEQLTVELASRLSASRIGEGRLLSVSGAWLDAERPLWDEYLAHPDSLSARYALRELYLRSGCRMTTDTGLTEAHCVAISDSGLIAAGGADGVVRLRQTDDGRHVSEIETKNSVVRGLCFVGYGKALAVAGSGGAGLVAVGGGPPRPLVASPASSVTAARSLIAVGGDDGQVQIFTSIGRPLAKQSVSKVAVRAVAIDADETRLAAIDNAGAVTLWDLARDGDGIRLTAGANIAGHTATGRSVDFSPDGKTLVTGAGDGYVRVWRTADGYAVAAERTKNGTARDVVFHADGRRIAVAGYWRTQVYELTAQSPYLVPAGRVDGESVMCRFTKSGHGLVTLATAGVCRTWDLDPEGPAEMRGTSKAEVRDLFVTTRDTQPCVIALQGDGTVTARTPAAGGGWDTLTEWSAKTAVRGMALDAAKGRLWLARDDGRVTGHDLMSGQQLDALLPQGVPARTVHLTPDGRTMVVGLGDGRITFWRLADGQWTKVHEDRCGSDVRGAALSRDGKTLFTTHRMSVMRTWSMADFRVINEVTRPTASYQPDFSPDCVGVAAGDWDRSVHVWKADATGAGDKPRLTLIGHNQLVNDVAFDGSGTLLATVATDGQWRLWDVSDRSDSADAGQRERRCLTTRDPDLGEATTVRFLPATDKQTLAVGYRDGAVRVWDLAAGDSYLDRNVDYQRGLRVAAKH